MQDKNEGFNLYLIRHAESMDNAGLTQEAWSAMARHNSRLSEKGLDQAARLGRRLAGQSFDYILASPLLRAVMTADAIVTNRSAGGPGRLEILPELTECDFPDIDEAYGLAAIRQVASRQTELLMARDTEEARSIIHASAGASQEEHFLRAGWVATYLQQRFYSGEEVAVVAHGAFNRYLLASLLGLKTLANLVIADNTSVTKIIFQPGAEAGEIRIALARFNDSSHL